MKTKFEHLVLGGTFDLLHNGHERLIDFAFQNGEKVTIGLTSRKMVLDLKKEAPFFTFYQRQNQLKDYLESKKHSNYRIVKIDDQYGVAVKDKSVDGIVVSAETKNGALKINQARSGLGLRELEVLVVPLVPDADGGKLSSTRIRSGKTSRTGIAYQCLIEGKNFKLPNSLRPAVAKPLGRIIQREEDLIKLAKRSTSVVAVGDEVTRTINKKAQIDLAIVDFLINRKRQISDMAQLGIDRDVSIVNVKNKAGTISPSLSQAIFSYFGNPTTRTVIKVNGEEDLAVIPVILCAPLKTLIVYGQRDRGAVAVYVSEKLKEKAYKLLMQFTTF